MRPGCESCSVNTEQRGPEGDRGRENGRRWNEVPECFAEGPLTSLAENLDHENSSHLLKRVICLTAFSEEEMNWLNEDSKADRTWTFVSEPARYVRRYERR
ncbi:hypothetical protein F7725_029057, partial [Dissostichus mawsoni]